MTDLNDKIALITGASRGIGRAVAIEAAKAGAHVILLARTQGGLEEVDDEIRAAGGKATLIPMDLRRLEKVDQLGPSILERFGKLDILVGNAGMLGPLTPAHQIDPKDWEKVMNVNFHANVRLVRTLDPLLRASEAGRVVFTGSSTYNRPRAYWSLYRASKSALNMFAMTYAAETEKTNMRVNIIHPYAVQTKMLDDAYPGGFSENPLSPEDIVPTFMELINSSCEKHGEPVEVK